MDKDTGANGVSSEQKHVIIRLTMACQNIFAMQAKIDELRKKADLDTLESTLKLAKENLKASFVDAGISELDFPEHKVTVSHTRGSFKLDPKLVAVALEVDVADLDIYGKRGRDTDRITITKKK